MNGASTAWQTAISAGSGIRLRQMAVLSVGLICDGGEEGAVFGGSVGTGWTSASESDCQQKANEQGEQPLLWLWREHWFGMKATQPRLKASNALCPTILYSQDDLPFKKTIYASRYQKQENL